MANAKCIVVRKEHLPAVDTTDVEAVCTNNVQTKGRKLKAYFFTFDCKRVDYIPFSTDLL